ncbi:NAD-dependent protein deacetylase [compost metagenome]
MNSSETVPRCKECGGIVKPDVVLYGESLDDEVIRNSVTAIAEADLLLIGGTSLTVQPAAHFVTYFQGGRTVLLNASSTAYDHRASLLITEPIGAVFAEVSEMLQF